MERCPVCRARRQDDETVCHRCGADLAVLLAIEAEVAALAQRLPSLLAAGQWLEVREVATRWLALQQDPLGAALLDFERGELMTREARLFERLLQ
jgi:predicted amidophosphoribosyltransferase